jgi:hypothetical protein
MRRLLPLIPLAVLLAACGGKSASESYAQQQIAACAKVQKTLAAIPRPVVKNARTAGARESRTLQVYAVKIDRALIAGVATLRSVPAPAKLQALQRRWLAAVRVALGARLRLDTAAPKRLKAASRAELKTRRAANGLAGQLSIASGCTLTY